MNFSADLRYAIRSLFARRNRLLAFLAIITLGVSIATGTIVFGVAHTVLWNALPFHEPDRLVSIRLDDHSQGQGGARLPTVAMAEAWEHDAATLVEIGFFQTGAAVLTEVGEPRR
jgi:hypothetical protein